MNTRILSSSFLSIAIFAVLFLLAVVATLPARAAGTFDIIFPVHELGNCADKNACKTYCSDETNRTACEQFSADHGLNTQTRESSDQKLQAVRQDGGPGNCAADAKDPQTACKVYCDSTSHIDECVTYGKSHGLLTGDKLAEAEKVSAALKAGAKLPEGCTDQSSCKAICENPSSIGQAKSCFAFGKAAGLLPPGFDEGRAEKVFQSIEDGTAPFKSPKDFEQCEHPADDVTLQKCVDFGVKSGMLSQDQADVIKKTGGKGPGGCQGEDACDMYCQDHQDECFQFSKANGLLTPDQQEHMQQGAEQFKQGLERASAAVRDCVTSAVGQDALDAITSGSSMPNQSMGEKMHSCFDRGRPSKNEPREGQDAGGDHLGSPPSDEQGRLMSPQQKGDEQSPQEMGQDSRVEDVMHGPDGSSQNEFQRGPQRQFQPNMQSNKQDRNQLRQFDRQRMPSPGAEGQWNQEGMPHDEHMMSPPSGTPPQSGEQNVNGAGPMPPSGDTGTLPPPPAPVSLLNTLKYPISALANALSALF